MAIRRISGSDSYKNPLKKTRIFHGLRILEISADFRIRIADFRIADFNDIFKGLSINKNYVLNFTFFVFSE